MPYQQIGQTEFSDGSNVKTRSREEMLRDALKRMGMNRPEADRTPAAESEAEMPQEVAAPQGSSFNFQKPSLSVEPQQGKAGISNLKAALSAKAEQPSLMGKEAMDLKSPMKVNGKAGNGSMIRSAMLSLGVPVKDMTKEEKKQAAANQEKVAAAEAKRAEEEKALLARIAQVGNALSPVGNYVGGGQSGSFGTGIGPRGF